jgi:hypothetical protein
MRATLALDDSAVEPHIISKWIGLSRSASWLWVTGAFRFLGEDFQTVTVILMTRAVQRVAAVEDAIHSTLEARGSKRHAPGVEWFDTTLEEVKSIIDFVLP